MSEQQLSMGLGEAISRMLNVEMNRRARLVPTAESLKEYNMIVEALNAHKITFTMSCESDPQVTGVEIFERSAHTSCCRIGGTSSGGSRS